MPQPFSTRPFGLPFIELQSIDSTNNYARQQIHAGLAQHGMAIFAHQQLAGKGQRGKSWATEKSANIVLSVLVKPHPLQITQQFHLIVCVAVALQEFFMKYAGDDTKIKWPNDLYWQDRKAGGVLVESVISSRESGGGNWEWSIVGIGININQLIFPTDLPNPVSLKQITGKNFNPVELAKELCIVFNKKFTELTEEGFENIYTTYLDNLYKRNATVKLKKDNIVFEALIESVSPSGKLIVQHAFQEEFNFGDIEWVIK